MLIAPSHAACEIVRRQYGLKPEAVCIIGHGYDAERPAEGIHSDRGSRIGSEQRLRVALLGQVAYPAKGAEAYSELMGRTRSLPIEWHVFGDTTVYGYGQRLERMGLGDRLHLHGAYRQEEIIGLLSRQAIDLSMLLPTCDETFCFTLSESLLAGVPAMVSNVGALPERVADSGAGIVVSSTQEAFEALCRLVEDRGQLRLLKDEAARFRHSTLKENAERHRQAYGACWEAVTTPRQTGSITDAEGELFRIYYQTTQPGESVGRDRGPSYHSSWWYPYYLRVKPLVPPACRGLAKRAYLSIRRHHS
jgi:glycosyltransferase involved in cell wall biosynthesis